MGGRCGECVIECTWASARASGIWLHRDVGSTLDALNARTARRESDDGKAPGDGS